MRIEELGFGSPKQPAATAAAADDAKPPPSGASEAGGERGRTIAVVSRRGALRWWLGARLSSLASWVGPAALAPAGEAERRLSSEH